MPGNSVPIEFGAGWLYMAPVGSTEPTDLVSSLDPAWLALGYTAAGTEFDYNPTYTPIVVEEVLGPIGNIATDRQIHIKFDLAQYTAANLKFARNGGTITGTGSSPRIVTPPRFGAEAYTALLWQSSDAKIRKVYRKCLQTGQIATQAKKATYATIPVDFQAFEIDGSDPFIEILDGLTLAA